MTSFCRDEKERKRKREREREGETSLCRPDGTTEGRLKGGEEFCDSFFLSLSIVAPGDSSGA